VNGPVLDVADVSVAYRRPDGSESIVVWRAGFSLQPGTILGLVGESGCGKSTLAATAIGFHPPGGRVLEGSAVFQGEDLLGLGLSDLRDIWGARLVYVSQNAGLSLNPALAIGKQIAHVLGRHLKLRGRKARNRIVELLDAVEIPQPDAALRRFPHEFSGGQQQRIGLAIAFACDPAVLVLDEPTTGLDVTTQARISALLKARVESAGTAVLHVSHDLALLGSLADEVSVMYGGEIVEHGPTATVLHAPRHPYTRALLAAAPTVSERRNVVGIEGRPPAEVILDACSFAARCRHVAPACLERHIEAEEISPGHLVRCIRSDIVASAIAARQRPVSVPTTDRSLLEVDELWCAYTKASAAAVAGVSLSMGHGETLGIVGESGSGKSTLLRSIAGLHPQVEGTIRFNGHGLAPNAVKRSTDIRAAIQIIFQNPDSSLNPRHTIAAILRRPVRLFDKRHSGADERAAILELLDSVKLSSRILSRYPAELSGGQKQRIAIARAFAARPALLLCDEITSALDTSVQATIMRLLDDLAASYGAAVIFVSHDLAVVRSIADRVIVLKDGSICEEAGIEELFLHPEHPYTRELLGAVPALGSPAANGGTPSG
jgi:oligopeptide/dipeptide ABC transporter ATP-binding protein